MFIECAWFGGYHDTGCHGHSRLATLSHFKQEGVKNAAGLSAERVKEIAAAGGEDPSKLKEIKPADVQMDGYLLQGIMGYGMDLFTHAVFEPRLSGWFAQKGWTPPYFDYVKLEIPCSPNHVGNDEIIPPEFLKVYKAYGKTEDDLEKVRAHLRAPHMTGTHTDIVTRASALSSPLPVAECYINETGKEMVAIAAVAVQIPSDYPDPVILTIIPLVMGSLIMRLRQHHEVAAFSETKRLEKFSVLEFHWKETFGQTMNRVFYARLAPARSDRVTGFGRISQPLVGTIAWNAARKADMAPQAPLIKKKQTKEKEETVATNKE
jgi:hypothetical protein